ncbi:MAG: LysM peptidoglycan-binding domain-containing protein [Planctomycetes bacterium]|nr:LysM peptidoglycan-binding domain-containing protein [Planctomycetota bacterium]
MILGLVLVTVTMLWFFGGANLNPKARILNLRSNGEPAAPPETFIPAKSTEADTAREESNPLPTTDSQSQEPEWKKYYQEEKIKTQRFHIISDGETLSEISRKYYDSARKWQKILDANKDVIEDVNKLKPGTKIIIPE